MLETKEIIENLGYKLKDCGNYWQCSANYRGGNNETALVIYPKDNLVVDFVSGEKFSIEDLIKKTLGIKTEEDWKKWKENKKFITPVQTYEPKIKLQKKFDPLMLNELMPIYDFYIQRGISEDTLRLFRCGLAYKGRLKNRIVFPIFNSKDEIIGFSGRDVSGSSPTKWKIFSGGNGKNWVYPAFLSKDAIKEKGEVILLESIGDALSCVECGVKNVLVLFGLDLNLSVLNYLLKTNPKKIIISTNNDKNLRGNTAAEKISDKLKKYFDYHQIEIRLPQTQNDWSDVLRLEGKESLLKQIMKTP